MSMIARPGTTRMSGRPVSPGFARGRAYLYGVVRAAVPKFRLGKESTREERRRFEEALRLAADDLARVRQRVEVELGSAEAEIFDAHLALLADRGFAGRIVDRIASEQVNAEWAVEAAVSEYAGELAVAEGELLRERAADIRDLGRRLLRHLARHDRMPLTCLPAGAVLVARELYPADLLEVDRAHLVGIVTELGGETGHAAILARALGIPAISGVEDATRRIGRDVEVFVDGTAGIVWIDPPADEIARFAEGAASYERGRAQAYCEEKLHSQTRDGMAIRLLANIGRAHEAESVGRHGLEGVGLFRTEYLFLDEPEAPDFDRQRSVYRSVAEQLSDRPVVVRTLDLGGDKIPRFLAPHREDNPMLGLRGLRFSLANGRPLFETQVRAILAVAAQGSDVRILLPMVLGPADFAAARAIIDELARREWSGVRSPVGAMIETPAAVFTIDAILELADFASLGTNDLTQFMLAADRNALDLVPDHAILHPAVLRALKTVADAGKRAGKAVCLCGEAAADATLTGLLVGLGIHELSMSPEASARVRQRIRALDSREAKALAQRALGCRGAEEIRAVIDAAPHNA